MALTTRCKFYYGVVITQDQNFIDFDEGSGELTALIPVGVYSPQQLADKLSSLLSNAGGQAYSVTFDRVNRLYTITAPAPFDLLISTGSHASTTLYDVLGFTGGLDLTGSNSYSAIDITGFEFEPQFLLLDYCPLEHQVKAVQASVNETATGDLEVLKYGTKRFMECSMDLITNEIFYDIDKEFWKASATGVEDALHFLNSIIEKCQIEFMPDLNDVDTYFSLILESTEGDRDGTGFKLNEMLDYGSGYYSTGKLKFREVTQ